MTRTYHAYQCWNQLFRSIEFKFSAKVYKQNKETLVMGRASISTGFSPKPTFEEEPGEGPENLSFLTLHWQKNFNVCYGLAYIKGLKPGPSTKSGPDPSLRRPFRRVSHQYLSKTLIVLHLFLKKKEINNTTMFILYYIFQGSFLPSLLISHSNML